MAKKLKKKKKATKPNKHPIYVATWESESTDSGVEGYWLNRPSERELTAHFKETMPWEFGEYGRTVWWEVVVLYESEIPEGIDVVQSI